MPSSSSSNGQNEGVSQSSGGYGQELRANWLSVVSQALQVHLREALCAKAGATNTCVRINLGREFKQ